MFEIMAFLLIVNIFRYFSLDWKFTVKTDFKNWLYKPIRYFLQIKSGFLEKIAYNDKNLIGYFRYNGKGNYLTKDFLNTRINH